MIYASPVSTRDATSHHKLKLIIVVTTCILLNVDMNYNLGVQSPDIITDGVATNGVSAGEDDGNGLLNHYDRNTDANDTLCQL